MRRHTMSEKNTAIVLVIILTCFIFITDSYAEKLDLASKLVLSAKSGGNISKGLQKAVVVSDTHIRLLVKGDTGAVRGFVESYGGSAGAVAGNIIAVSLPIDMVSQLAEEEYVQRIEAERRLRKRNDAAAEHVGVRDVQLGLDPLDTGYIGEGVIVGVIDSGIDIRHEAFAAKDDPAKSRILSIWDQGATDGTPPAGYDYGVEWTREQIESDLANGTETVTHRDNDGHGSHVAATAAGTGSPEGDYTGMAPGADIIMVAYGEGGEIEGLGDYIDQELKFHTSVIDAARYIYDKASELGRPAVINASIGTQFSPHNGSTLMEQALDNLLMEKPGRVFCASAGNSGTDYIHWSVDALGSDPSWSYALAVLEMYDDEETPLILQYAVIETDDPDNTALSVGFDIFNENGESEQVDQTSWVTIKELADTKDGFFHYYGEQGDTFDASVVLIAEETEQPGVYNLVLYAEDIIDIDEDDQYTNANPLRLMAKGSGSIHAWNIIAATKDDIDYYIEPEGEGFTPLDTRYTVEIPGTAELVIAVAAYNNVETFVNSTGTTMPDQEERQPVGKIADFSSIGPTSDGRMKPDIAAPGHLVTSALSADADPDEYEDMIIVGGKYANLSGTSMATPVTTGSIALYLEQNPTASVSQVRNAILLSVDKDEYTGDVPNEYFGYGKLNIFNAMATITTQVASDKNGIPAAFEIGQNFPNPFNPSTTVPYTINMPGVVDISIYNMLGQEITTLVDRYHGPGNYVTRWNGLNMNGNEVSGGVYYYKLKAADTTISRKMLLVK